MILAEGGNVFKNQDGSEATQRISRDNVVPTVKWLEGLTGLSLVDNMLGTTGRKETSGDLDLAVDADRIDKQTLIDVLLKQGIPAADIRKSGDNVHLKTPILGDPANGYVQTDFMFGRPAWQHFAMAGSPEGSPYKGLHRHLLLASIAKAQGMKWSYKNGLLDRATDQVITQDPTEIAQKLFNGTAPDLESVESIVAKIKGRADYDDLTTDARAAFARENLSLPESTTVAEGSSQWFRKFIL